MELPRQEYWSGLPFSSPGDLPHPGIEPGSPALQTDSLPLEPLRKPLEYSEVTAWNWMTYFEPRIWQVTPKLIELGRLTALFWNVRGCQKSDVGGKPLSLQPHPNNRKKEFRGNREKWYLILYISEIWENNCIFETRKCYKNQIQRIRDLGNWKYDIRNWESEFKLYGNSVNHVWQSENSSVSIVFFF